MKSAERISREKAKEEEYLKKKNSVLLNEQKMSGRIGG